jgi:16S rRNA (cytidine1402-2'-O)-methyltransferase
MCAARELTKVHEEFLRGTIPFIRQHFATTAPRGEITLVIAGASAPRGERDESWDDTRVCAEMRALLQHGVPRSEAVKRVARAARRARREVYELTLNESR